MTLSSNFLGVNVTFHIQDIGVAVCMSCVRVRPKASNKDRHDRV